MQVSSPQCCYLKRFLFQVAIRIFERDVFTVAIAGMEVLELISVYR